MKKRKRSASARRADDHDHDHDHDQDHDHDAARPRHAARGPRTTPPVTHPVLQRFYPQVLPLRQFLLSRLVRASTRKRRRIAQLGLAREPTAAPGAVAADDLRRLLDDTWVGAAQHAAPAELADLESDLEIFSQQLPATSSASDVFPELQSEIVDFVIRSLFRKHPGLHRPPHLLCHGYERASYPDHGAGQPEAPPSMSGLVSRCPNSHVETVKGPAWSALLVALGHGGDRIMIELLMSCGVFASLDGPSGSCYQLSGKPLADLEPVLPHRGLQNKSAEREVSIPAAGPKKPRNKDSDSLTALTFVRSRMLYARAALNAKGEVCFGLRHIHVLNRLSDHTSLEQTVHILKYIFPRQFGLHNVFTSKTDYRDTSLPFKDYTLREQEISYDRARKRSKKGQGVSDTSKIKEAIPKRLRGHVVDLIRRLRILHRRCSYVDLLRYYCPVFLSNERLQTSHADCRREESPAEYEPEKTSAAQMFDSGNKNGQSARKREISPPIKLDNVCFTDYATPHHEVSAFCRAVLSRVVPDGFWGEGETQAQNKHVFLRHVDRFISLRRFESLTLHEVLQDMKVANVAWLRPPNVQPECKMSQTDFSKRRQLLAELVYYLFDSFLILLIRTNFHVTESNLDKNRLHYFRHDIWRKLSEPAIVQLKTTIFEELKAESAHKLLSGRQLGYSQVRLLPKKAGARPITNLRRRMQITVNGKPVLGRSINSVMRPVFSILNFEKTKQPTRLGSSLFSVGDMYPRLKGFRTMLEDRGLAGKPLYFVKVDVKSCFDTIPQAQLLTMIKRLLHLENYSVKKYVEVNTAVPWRYSKKATSAVKPVKRYLAQASAAGDQPDFEDFLRKELGIKARRAVYVDSVIEQQRSRTDLLKLLTEHVERNIVKIGKKFYRQKIGIPQGSILSSLLCNFFYAEMEANLLGFLAGSTSVLLRLIDDSLLITTEREHAERFLQIMHAGNDDYGISIKRDKTLVNFTCKINGSEVPRVPSRTSFPYCGTFIDTEDLNIRKDIQAKDQRQLRDGLTVEFSKLPGQTFHRKTLNALKIQLHGMLLDTSFNDKRTVLGNVYRGFVDAARKCFLYIKSLPMQKRRNDGLLIKTVHDVAALATGMMRRKRGRGRAAAWEGYGCEVSRRHTKWLCCHAFRSVFQRKQTRHAVLLQWLAVSMAATRPRGRAERTQLTQAVSEGECMR